MATKRDSINGYEKIATGNEVIASSIVGISNSSSSIDAVLTPDNATVGLDGNIFTCSDALFLRYLTDNDIVSFNTSGVYYLKKLSDITFYLSTSIGGAAETFASGACRVATPGIKIKNTFRTVNAVIKDGKIIATGNPLYLAGGGDGYYISLPPVSTVINGFSCNINLTIENSSTANIVIRSDVADNAVNVTDTSELVSADYRPAGSANYKVVGNVNTEIKQFKLTCIYRNNVWLVFGGVSDGI